MIFSFLFRCLIYFSFLRIVKFLSAILTSIFWYLSFSHRNMNAITAWTYFIKISRYLKKFIIGLFNKSIFLSFQKLISNFSIVTNLIRKSVWDVISN